MPWLQAERHGRREKAESLSEWDGEEDGTE